MVLKRIVKMPPSGIITILWAYNKKNRMNLLRKNKCVHNKWSILWQKM